MLLLFLDYGSGRNPKEGFLSSDFIGSPNYDFYIKEYVVLEAEDGSFDGIHCRNVIHHIPEEDLIKVFNEFDRLLKKGDKLIISEPREEFHTQNLILDIIWYRFLVQDFLIKLPNKKYVNFKKYLSNYNFKLESVENEYNNEILTYIKE